MEETKAIQKKEKSEALTMQPSYKNFVDYGRLLIGRIERNQLELARLCYRANKELANPGYRSDLEKSKNQNDTSLTALRGSEPKTFTAFCKDIGISKVTGYKAIAAYNAKEDRLYTKEEMKQIAEDAWNAVCTEIHDHRINGEPGWKPDNWNESLEFRYDTWLIQHGFKRPEVNPSILNGTRLPAADYPSSGPFAFSFIDSIGHYCVEETSGDGAIRFFEMTERYKNRVPKDVAPNDLFRIPVMVKGAIAQLPPYARKEATILVANILRDYVEDEV